MTNEQINAAIAKVLKYKQWYPNFATDLNAMHGAEKVLAQAQTDEYIAVLFDSTYEATLATARQRAEAFLRTLGKWEEGE
jgi:hypothetical protein